MSSRIWDGAHNEYLIMNESLVPFSLELFHQMNNPGHQDTTKPSVLLSNYRVFWAMISWVNKQNTDVSERWFRLSALLEPTHLLCIHPGSALVTVCVWSMPFRSPVHTRRISIIPFLTGTWTDCALRQISVASTEINRSSNSKYRSVREPRNYSFV